ncbi:hypothetical protein [Branchiibius cervicis]|uniref:PqqD family protein n=1 Tax=Branchiibius cervicis TaxID=908252 RepID=A0ABW2AV11_9MICO
MTAAYRLGADTGIVVRREPDLIVYLANLVSGEITVAPGVSAVAILQAIGDDPSEADSRLQPVIDAVVSSGLLVEVIR